MEPQRTSRKDARRRDAKRGTTMENNDIAWQSELSRRARIYEDIEAGDRFEGTMSTLDYCGMTVLTLVLVVGFWLWGA
jgi:hypothetical protein